MFSTFTKIPGIGRANDLPAVALIAISNGTQHATTDDVRGRPRLVCRWRPDAATSKPACGWGFDDGTVTLVGEPSMGEKEGQMPILFTPSA
jgi:hypothetical protein